MACVYGFEQPIRGHHGEIYFNTGNSKYKTGWWLGHPSEQYESQLG